MSAKAKRSKSAKSKKSVAKKAPAEVSVSKTASRWHARAVEPPKLNASTWQAANVVAALLAVMVVMQLASFNDFANQLEELGVSNGGLWAAIVVLAQVWAIPALIRVRISPLFRNISAAMLVGVAGFWFLLTAGALSRGVESDNIGIFGTFADVPVSGWTVVFTSAYLGVALYLAGKVKSQ